MEAVINETVPQEIGPILQLNRPLLPIGEYANREGITKGLIEECGRLGIVPIRRYKGKTFVVDVPIHSYSDKYEIIGAPMKAPDKKTRADRISKPPEKLTESSEIDDMLVKFSVDIDRNGTVFNSIQKDFPERLEIADEQTVAIDNEIELTEEIAQLQNEANETVGKTRQRHYRPGREYLSINPNPAIQITRSYRQADDRTRPEIPAGNSTRCNSNTRTAGI